MNENKFNKIKSALLFMMCGCLLGIVSFLFLFKDIRTTTILYTEVSNTGEIGYIETGEIKDGQPSITTGASKPKATIRDGKSKNTNSEGEKPTYTGSIRHSGFPADSIVQDYVNYAYKIGGENLLLLIECENGGRDLDLQSRVQQKYGREKSYGLCQLGLPRKGIDTQKFLTDYKYQIETCWKYRSSGTPFFGPERKIYKNGKYLGMCYQVVKSRFIGLK